jgi:hypothetical protein
MAWGRKETPVPPSDPVQSEARPDAIISQMLSAYQHFYETAKGKPDPAVQTAKATIERANRIISDSGIGYSVCVLVDQFYTGMLGQGGTTFSDMLPFPSRT